MGMFTAHSWRKGVCVYYCRNSTPTAIICVKNTRIAILHLQRELESSENMVDGGWPKVF